eukprot:NODE_4920_length_722_cov_53.184874_g4757_i0.p1 GENE.NODE_4920_length_722_cov_53.184874_g4757_i0~~NODE_4920_length_722_cov_53.184874_g4757_i0.p1  ORF type:complete len:209 (+),score=34.66 NODE_4920_length_722_cov_53.184874_g4757_i0:60-686(+)
MHMHEAASEDVHSQSHTDNPTIKHPLWCRWSLWYDATKRNSPRQDWQDNLKQIYTFDTIEDFWSVYNNIHSPSQMAYGANYHLFKHGITPTWEHISNARGGKWTISVPRKWRAQLDTFWTFLSLALIGENFKEGDAICGAVVSLRKSNDRISLWTSDAYNEEQCLSLGRQMREFLNLQSTDLKLIYQAHADAVQNDCSYGNTPLYFID